MRIAKRNHEEQTPRDHIRIINRRIDWLNKRIKEARNERRHAHFDISERDALKWLVEEVRKWVDIPDDDEDDDLLLFPERMQK